MAMANGGGDETTKLVFVYGTLKRRFYNHRLIDDLTTTGDATFLGAYTTATAFPLVCGPHGIPYLINLPSSGLRIRGELYSVTTGRGLARLDDLEGVDRGHYERLPVTVTATAAEEEKGGEKSVEAEAYFAHRGFGEALWKRCGEKGLNEYSLELGSKYVRWEDRPKGSSFVQDIHTFIAEAN